MITQTPRLVIRNWQEKDRDIFCRLNRNERIMNFFLSRSASRTPMIFLTATAPQSAALVFMLSSNKTMAH